MLGVILWAILMGEPLFTHECDKLCEKQIMDAAFLDSEFAKAKTRLSPPAYDLLSKMLQRVPDNRLTAKEALSHPFIMKSYSPADYAQTYGEGVAMFDTDLVRKMEGFVQ